jgi:hypothetical protein
MAHAGGAWRLLELGTEGVANSMNRSNDGRAGISIAEPASDLFDQSHQGGVADERSGPEALMQFRLGDDAWRLADQEHEQIECLRGEVHDRVIATRLSPRDINRTRAES